jgi:hypothetical protein
MTRYSNHRLQFSLGIRSAACPEEVLTHENIFHRQLVMQRRVYSKEPLNASTLLINIFVVYFTVQLMPFSKPF